MPGIKTTRVMRALESKGFRRRERKHHILCYYHDDKKTSVQTVLSHGRNEISDPLISSMARQLNLSKDQFEELVNCPLSAQMYERILRDKGVI